MGLFSKEACVFCGTEVGMLKRSKLASKEFICNDCKRKTHFFARMDYTSKDAAQNMMETLGVEEADFEASFDSAENRFQAAQRSFNTWDLGNLRVHYRCNTRSGAFQIKVDAMSRYEHIPVLYFDTLIPYKYAPNNEILADIRRNEVTNTNINYVTVEESKDAEGNITSSTVVIPYNSDCIREIKLKGDIRSKEEEKAFYDFARRINQDRINWLNNGLYDEARKKMQARNLEDTAMAVLKAATTGGSVEEALKQGVEMANDIEQGKIKQGLFGKLIKK